MTRPSWIDCDVCTKIGTIGYLVMTTNTNTGRDSWSLRERPARTNQSHEPRLFGWVGETDNRSSHARGVVKVMGLNRLGDRCRIANVTGDELRAFLAASTCGISTFNGVRADIRNMLPAAQHRCGHELTCEVVHPECLEKTRPGHGPEATRIEVGKVLTPRYEVE